MGYAVKVNELARDIVIHFDSCFEVEKRGGAPGKYNQVHWDYFETLKEAEEHARKWQQSKGWLPKLCSKCKPQG